MSTPRWLVRQDLDGFFGLALNNLIQILVLVVLCQQVLEFPNYCNFSYILSQNAGRVSWFA